jgi:hypothetical protein
MKLCMFAPRGQDLERGWPGRIDGESVIQLAAQTLQAFFTGGGQAREHAEYPLADVVFRAPVLHPPSVRIFDSFKDFRFANPAAIVVGGSEPELPDGATGLVPRRFDAAIIGADGRIGGFTELVEWTASGLSGEKSRDFALALGPIVTTPDEDWPPRWVSEEWDHMIWQAAQNTRLYPGDLIAA